MNKPLRAGVVGCGKIAKRHAAQLVALKNVQLVSCCDHKLENAAAFSLEFGGCRPYTDCEAMFAELDLDLVYICLPPFAHRNEVELACRYGMLFLIEKPIALTMDQALRMAEQVRASAVKSQVGFIFRHGEAVQWLKQQPDGPGAPAFMSARYACNSLHRWWWRERDKSGGQLLEQIIHLLDLARYLLGEPVQVYSAQDNLFHRQVTDYTVEDASATVIRFASGSLAVIAATNGAIPGRWDSDWRVVRQNLTADVTNANHAVMYHTDQSPPTTTVVAAETDLFRAQTLDFVAAIRGNRPTLAPIEEGVRSLGLALAAVRSAETGSAVHMEDVCL
jgi:predicted dehydrogenase